MGGGYFKFWQWQKSPQQNAQKSGRIFQKNAGKKWRKNPGKNRRNLPRKIAQKTAGNLQKKRREAFQKPQKIRGGGVKNRGSIFLGKANSFRCTTICLPPSRILPENRPQNGSRPRAEGV